MAPLTLLGCLGWLLRMLWFGSRHKDMGVVQSVAHGDVTQILQEEISSLLVKGLSQVVHEAES